jgi:hypothetical protein
MTRRQIEEVVTTMGEAERYRIRSLCPEHQWSKLPTTETGEHYC